MSGRNAMRTAETPRQLLLDMLCGTLPSAADCPGLEDTQIPTELTAIVRDTIGLQRVVPIWEGKVPDIFILICICPQKRLCPLPFLPVQQALRSPDPSALSLQSKQNSNKDTLSRTAETCDRYP